VDCEYAVLMQQRSPTLSNSVSSPHLRYDVEALRLPQANKTPDPRICMRPTGTSWPPNGPACARLKFCDRTTGAKRVVRRRAFHLVAVDHHPPPLISRCRLSLQTCFQVIHHQDQAPPIPLSTFHSYCFLVLLCPCSPSLPNPTPLLSRRTTQQDFLFFAKKNDDHQVKSSLRDAVLPCSGVNVDGAACTPHARRAAAPC
jgi:hypothetical protein